MLWLLAIALADDARVVGIQELDYTGHWVDQTAAREAWVVRPDGQTELLGVGTLVPMEQEVVTQESRVRLQLAPDKTVTVYENTKIVPKEWGVLQEIGAALYDVHQSFRVQYGRTEAIVEGTRFRVAGSGQDAEVVVVERGLVRVANDLGEVHVPAGKQASLRPGEPPTLQVATAAAGGAGSAPATKRWAVGLRAGGGYSQQAGQTEWGGLVTSQLFVRRQIAGPLRVTLDAGLLNTMETTGFPTSLGLEWGFGAVSAGLRGQVMFGVQGGCGGGTVTLAAPGGVSANVGVEVPLGSTFLLEGRATGGWVDGFFVNGTAGVEVAF